MRIVCLQLKGDLVIVVINLWDSEAEYCFYSCPSVCSYVCLSDCP